MDQRTSIITATAELLAASTVADISTRAVCDAAGVQQPVIYRLFGDKDGLLAATVDYAFERYLASKRSAVASDDPVDDIRHGWDAHTAFAIDNPNFYQLMFGAGLKREPNAVKESHQLLREIVERVARSGRLLTDPATATRAIMAANTGVALALITRREIYSDQDISRTVRDITLAGLVADSQPGAAASPVAAALRTLTATISDAEPAELTAAERGLLAEWLQRMTPKP
jgi:AcrR family transcriptional regulator